MIKRISIGDVAMGMYIHALDGPWLSHPFWRTHFLLSCPGDLQALQRCGISAVWVDLAKGQVALPAAAGVAPQAAAARPAAVVGGAGDEGGAGRVGRPDGGRRSGPPPHPGGPPPAPAPPRAELQDEIERAEKLLRRSRRVMSTVLRQARLGRPADVVACLAVVDDIAASLTRNPSAFPALARIKGRDDHIYMHAIAVGALMVAAARQLGLPDAVVREAGLAGLLHDVGQSQVPLDVLNKPGRLSDAESSIVQQHPLASYRLLEPHVPYAVLDVCLHHHERLDGSGYPHRAAAPQISQLARLAAVCDVYDTLSSRRPFKAELDPAHALQVIASSKGQLDPAMVHALRLSLGGYPTGSLVRLRSGRLAVVVDQNAGALSEPIVKVFFSTQSGMPVPAHLLDLSEADSSDVILAREPREHWGFSHLEEVWNPLARRRS